MLLLSVFVRPVFCGVFCRGGGASSGRGGVADPRPGAASPWGWGCCRRRFSTTPETSSSHGQPACCSHRRRPRWSLPGVRVVRCHQLHEPHPGLGRSGGLPPPGEARRGVLALAHPVCGRLLREFAAASLRGPFLTSSMSGTVARPAVGTVTKPLPHPRDCHTAHSVDRSTPRSTPPTTWASLPRHPSRRWSPPEAIRTAKRQRQRSSTLQAPAQAPAQSTTQPTTEPSQRSTAVSRRQPRHTATSHENKNPHRRAARQRRPNRTHRSPQPKGAGRHPQQTTTAASSRGSRRREQPARIVAL